LIPINAIIGLRFIQQHPFVTSVVIAVLIALAILAAIRSRRSPQRKKALRAVSLALVTGAACFFSWAYNTRGPGLFEHAAKYADQIAAEQQAQQKAEK
jgi:ABC-type nickel/cobalt efflux system permease component RcnA